MALDKLKGEIGRQTWRENGTGNGRENGSGDGTVCVLLRAGQHVN